MQSPRKYLENSFQTLCAAFQEFPNDKLNFFTIQIIKRDYVKKKKPKKKTGLLCIIFNCFSFFSLMGMLIHEGNRHKETDTGTLDKL